MKTSKKILISPLDWGLGHASRLLSLMQKLEKQHELIIGVNSCTEKFIKENIKNARFEEVPSYRIRYSKWGSFWSFLKLGPGLLQAKREEELWVKEFVKKYQIDLIISDSRFGFRHPDIKSVILSHQLNLQYPTSWSIPGKIAQKINHNWLSAFDEVWIPDDENHKLSGDLSLNKDLKSKFVGVQSRFTHEIFPKPEEEPYVLCIVSGPEPQRSQLEKMVRQQSPQIPQHVIIVGGRPDKKCKSFDCANTTYYHHMDTTQLSQYIQHADLVISRSGYSSIMDYDRLNSKKLFLIPTPGQTEQIYLAKRLKKLGVCDFSYQNKFSLLNALSKEVSWSGFTSVSQSDQDVSKFI